MISLIVAKAENGVIGADGKMPWHLSEDLRYFKRVTMGKTVLMGRKTYESIGKPLPGRKNVVFTRRPETIVAESTPTAPIKIIGDVTTFIPRALHSPEEMFVIGGAEIYRLFLPYASKLYVTEIYQKFNGNATFPAVDNDRFREIGRTSNGETLKFDFVVYVRRL